MLILKKSKTVTTENSLLEDIHLLLVFLRTGFRINKQNEGLVNLKQW